MVSEVIKEIESQKLEKKRGSTLNSRVSVKDNQGRVSGMFDQM